MSDATPSDLEVLALTAALHLEEEAYGVAIRDEILRRTGRSVSVGSLYKAIRRMETQGWVRTVVGDPTAVRGGRAKKFVEVRPEGRDALRRSVRELERMLDGLDVELKTT